ncbi:hypothetical protein BVC80_917g26 [Macleaya cordata]|uniref:Uncharacterized protein n=1 Tax=Macleaya cordata TaxID=56857 RepID=A0A200QJ53_MACCD|nr:hypothetical protein BVC80_917g26 [Macleaya cordata]
MTSILRSHKLYKYVDPDVPIPPSHITDPTTNTSRPNPAFEDSNDVDQTLLTWIHVTLTDPVHSQVLGLKTAREVWIALEKSFADQNTARVLQLKSNKQVLDIDLVLYVLHGLGPDYEPFYTTITTHPPLSSFHELYSLLLAQETRVQSLQQQQSDLTQTMAFLAGSSSQSQPQRLSNQQRSSSNSSYDI